MEAARPPAIVQRNQQAVQKLQQDFKAALFNVAENRKKIYDIIIELKEHFHEYGFKSPRAAVETVCQRSKTWSNDFCAQIEAEAEIYKVTGIPVGVADNEDKEKEETLNKIADLADPDEKPAVHSADEKTRPEPKTKNANGKPKSELPVWTELEELFGKALNRLDVAQHQCHNNAIHDELISFTKKCLDGVRRWKKVLHG